MEKKSKTLKRKRANFQLPLRRLQISDEDSIDENEANKNSHLPPRFQRSRTMPKHTRNELFNANEEKLSTFSQQRPPQVLNHPKIPPKPPPRRTLPTRYEPEGMQPQTVTANFQERKSFPVAIVQKPEKLARESSKVPLTSINFNHQQHLLHHAKPQHFSSSQNHNTSQQHHHNFNNNFMVSPQQVFHRPPLHHQQLVIANMQMRMNVMKMKNGRNAESSGSDPENHIYEMIDEYEVSGQKKENLPAIVTQQQLVTNESDDLFQNLLRTEMVQLCGRRSAYMSHLPHEKRIDIIQETALSLATAAYQEKAAQRMVSAAAANGSKTRSQGPERGGFCGAVQRAPPAMPPSLLRRMSNKENLGFGRVKVMLRVSDNPPDDKNTFLTIDKKKRQVTLSEPTSQQPTTPGSSQSASLDRGPMVSAPKMFAFDALHTMEDSQVDVCASALSEVIPAVLEGSDGCLLAIGYPGAGQHRTMFGSMTSSSELGAIPCAITWLYKGINEKRQKSGSRFSVRVSALGINATKPGSSAKDLLAALATESDESPGIYLRDDFLGGPTELRAPTAERAALFLDAALAGRTNNLYEPALIFTLHVYQYSLGAGKGGVAGGRSRLHLIDLGGCANRSGGLPLSGVGNVVLSILSGQRHPPNRDHPLTPLLKDCLAPLTCHVAIIAHVTHSQTHADSLTTIQLASRIHRLRRRKHKFPLSSDKSGSGNTQSGSSSGADPTSSDFSADTVIYVGPSLDDATDNEHPPVFLPNLNSGDNRCAMNKVLRGSAVEKTSTLPKSPIKKANAQKSSTLNSPSHHHQKTDSLKRNQSKHLVENSTIMHSPSDHTIYAQIAAASGSTMIVAGALKHTSVNKSSNFPTPKNSPMRKNPSSTNQEGSPSRKIEEKWIDGPRVSKYRVAEARHLMREINHVKKCETWIDGPNMGQPIPSLQTIANVTTHGGAVVGYGYMDSHKKKMIRQWVENQTCQILQQITPTTTAPVQYHSYYKSQSSQKLDSVPVTSKNEDDRSSVASSKPDEFVNPLGAGLISLPNVNYAESSIKTGLKIEHDLEIRSEKSASNISENRLIGIQSVCGDFEVEEEDQDSGPSEVPPALPLIDPLCSREVSRHVSRESLAHNIVMMDCALQVTEDDIAKAMGGEHPLSALSNGDISVVSSFNVGDTFSECIIGDSSRNQFDQLARLRELFNSQLAMAEVTPAFRLDAGSVYSEPAFRFTAGPGSVCSEPVFRAPSPGRCRDCRQSISRTPSETSLPSLNGIVAIAGMEPYASLRHPDGASDPNIKQTLDKCDMEEKIEVHIKENPLAELCETDLMVAKKTTPLLSQYKSPPPHLPLLPVSTPEAYDSGHDSTPRASKHSGMSRRAESGYHSVATATVRDSDESSFSSAASRHHQKNLERHEKNATSGKKKSRQDKSLCQWLRNPFTCTYPDTEGDVSDF